MNWRARGTERNEIYSPLEKSATKMKAVKKHGVVNNENGDGDDDDDNDKRSNQERKKTHLA